MARMTFFKAVFSPVLLQPRLSGNTDGVFFGFFFFYILMMKTIKSRTISALLGNHFPPTHEAAPESSAITSSVPSPPACPLIGHLEECLLLQSAAVELRFAEESQVFPSQMFFFYKILDSLKIYIYFLNVKQDHSYVAKAPRLQPTQVKILLTRPRLCN